MENTSNGPAKSITSTSLKSNIPIFLRDKYFHLIIFFSSKQTTSTCLEEIKKIPFEPDEALA